MSVEWCNGSEKSTKYEVLTSKSPVMAYLRQRKTIHCTQNLNEFLFSSKSRYANTVVWNSIWLSTDISMKSIPIFYWLYWTGARVRRFSSLCGKIGQDWVSSHNQFFPSSWKISTNCLKKDFTCAWWDMSTIWHSQTMEQRIKMWLHKLLNDPKTVILQNTTEPIVVTILRSLCSKMNDY